MNAFGPLIDELVVRAPVVTDGGWGTEMLSMGLPSGQVPDFWNVTHPQFVEAVAASYVAAGSRIILTNTFRANRFALGDDIDVTTINRAGARISRRAAGARASVFGSIGPTNVMLAGGDVDEVALRDAFLEQASGLARGGADALVIETMSDIAEAVLAVEAVSEVGLPVVACMSFDSGEQHDRTVTGVTPADAARQLAAAGADAIGANCGIGVDRAVPICAALVAATDLPVWIKANARRPDVVDGEAVYRMLPDEFAGHVERLVGEGATFVGGCCGTTPEFVAAIADVLG